jgi:C4-dicarboxylate transporter, DctM subunit
VIYGVWSETSIGALFIAGIMPGLILAVLFAIAVVVQRKHYPYRVNGSEDLLSGGMGADELKGALAVAAIFIIVIGGIYAGIFTPTEASGVGVIGVALVAAAMGRFSIAAMRRALHETIRTSAAVFIILAGGVVFSRFLVQTRLTETLVSMVSGLDVPPQLMMVALAGLYLLLGAIMDTFGMLILTLPLVLPITVSLGYDPIWTGVYLTVLMEIAMITPPVGLNVFILERVSGVPAQTIFRGVWPFVVAALGLVLLLIWIPELALRLPATMR